MKETLSVHIIQFEFWLKIIKPQYICVHLKSKNS
jgi:hypothetical protein